MSEKGQGTEGMLPVGTGTVLAEPGGSSGAGTTAPQKPQYEGRQPTEAEREAGRWLDEPTDPGSQPTGSAGAARAGSAEDATEWIDDKTFIGPGGIPFEFQPTEGSPPGTGSAVPVEPTPEQPSEQRQSPPARPPEEMRGPSGPPSRGPTQIEPPDFDLEPSTADEGGTSSLEYIDTKGETPGREDDHRTVIS